MKGGLKYFMAWRKKIFFSPALDALLRDATMSVKQSLHTKGRHIMTLSIISNHVS